MIRRLLPLLDPASRRRMLAAIALAAVASALEAITILSLLAPAGQLLDGREPTAAWAVVAAAALWAAATAAATSLARECGYGLSLDLHRRTADHLLRLPLRWFGQRRVGEVSRLAGSQVMEVMAYPGHLMLPAVRAAATPVALAAAMLAVDPVTGLVAAATLPLLLWCHRWSLRRVTSGDAALAEARAEAAGRVLEFAEIQRVSRLTPDPGHAERLTDAALVEASGRSGHLIRSVIPGIAVFALAVQSAGAALLAVAAVRAASGSVTAVDASVLLLLAAALVASLRSAAELGAATRTARGSLDRVRAFLDLEPLPEPDRPLARPSDAGAARIELCSVTVRHDGGTTALDRIDLVAEPGTCTAVVGASGSGKTTLLGLLARAADPDEGSVLLDGADLRDLGTVETVRHLALVPQEPLLAEGTIRGNVRLARPEATDAEVDAAVRAAGLEEVARRLPEGLDSPVGESGGLLSGGERQRVCLARALLRDAPVLLLDEPTAGLDARHQGVVDDAIAQLRGRRTVVMTAHRLESVREADQIVVLDGGRIVQRGGHDELLAQPGAYRSLWGSHTTTEPTSQEATT
ncbi:ABC transporter ATP-binding protein/permease [Glycomyces sp. L485]|uniref:ABC transporter ATP-binding protein n=1 Tax=Glycomyces sp. L485 TaxID=2909235 RepID=UPI001F4AE1FB|nr:ABC transporter ATP-binding protein [Glycomyces sp. L485]MCH7231995.1 ABC transporter ATP-binding protein/permease [Glycomyces sp. L485]